MRDYLQTLDPLEGPAPEARHAAVASRADCDKMAIAVDGDLDPADHEGVLCVPGFYRAPLA